MPINMYFSGTALGTVISIPTSGLIAGSPLGWEGVFYLHGGMAVLWLFAWVALVTDCPDEHRWISKVGRVWNDENAFKKRQDTFFVFLRL